MDLDERFRIVGFLYGNKLLPRKLEVRLLTLLCFLFPMIIKTQQEFGYRSNTLIVLKFDMLLTLFGLFTKPEGK